MKKLLMILLILMIPVRVCADLTGTEGLAIDLSSAGAGTDFTIAFDPTELLGNRTWGDASTDTIVWTFNRATGTDPTITFNNGSIAFPAITLTTDLVVAEGGTGVSTFTDGGPLLGSGAGAITAMSVLGDGEIIIGDGTTDPVALDVGSSTAITILGTIATGVWQGTAIADGYVPNNITIDLATLATTVTAANEATDTTCFPVFVTAATGSLGAKTVATLTFNSNTGAFGATSLNEGGTAVYNTTESDAAYQPLEATLTDIADGTIAENLVNTANPWADNEVADNITITNISQVADISATASEINTPLDGATVTLTEFQELQTIGATTISANQWVALGSLAETLTGAEVNILDGVTGVTAAELSYIGDVTGLIQSQIDGKEGTLSDKASLESTISDVADFAEADGDTWTGVHDFGGADLEIPQASPAVPGVDGGIEVDFTDGKIVIQHGSAHAELGASTDVVMGTFIRCWGGTIYEPDGVNDVMTVKAINSIEFPHGVVITAVYLGVSENSNYTLTVQNFDDFDTINGANGTIDTVAYTADTTGEVIDTTPTYATIAAGQLIMISIPSTDVDWIHFEIYYYEPAA